MDNSFKLTAVGVGPGDPELITIKGLRTIQNADLIFVPRSRDGSQSLALRIAEPWLQSEQEIVELPLPMTRNPDELIPAWQATADRIADSFAQQIPKQPQGVYLLLGDPLLYGTFTYIWYELMDRHSHIEIEIIPGITSFAAAAAVAQMPLCATSDRVAILPASYETDTKQLQSLLSNYETIIFLKVGPVFTHLVATLERMDLLDTTLYAERVGMPEEYLALGPELLTLKNQRRPYLSLLIVKRKGE